MDRQAKLAITAFCIVIIALMALAAAGYFSGAWDQPPSPP